MRLIDENQSIDLNGNSTTGEHFIAWSRAKKRLETKLGQSVFNRWINPLELEGVNQGCATFRAPGEYVRYYVDTHYRDQIRQSLKSEITSITQIRLRAVLEATRSGEQSEAKPNTSVAIGPARVSAEPRQSVAEPAPLAGGSGDDSGMKVILPRTKTFENFVVGQSNKIAFLAAKRFVEAPTQALNPLYIYGKVGTGKSHLAKAISVAAHAQDPGGNVVYLSAERFMYHFVRSLKDRNTLAFKDALRDVSVLVLDDVGFIGNKATTREEFFHTLDVLLSEGRRIVCCADVPPSRLEGMGERIVSRLGQGTVVGIEAPDFELRRNILKAKLEAASAENGLHVRLSDQLLDFMASNLNDNVRTLEGAVNRILSHTGSHAGDGTEITVDVLKSQIISDLLQTRKPVLTIKEIQKCVADYFGLQVSDLCSKRRTKDVVKARHLAMFIIRKETTKSYPQIAMKFGKMDHTSILHAVRKMEALSETDHEICEHIEAIRRKLGL